LNWKKAPGRPDIAFPGKKNPIDILRENGVKV